MMADLLIQSGQADIVVAGGMESMTQAPYLLPDARAGMRMGDKKVIDSMMFDGLFCAIDQLAMGGATEKYAASAGLDRDAQDELAYKSPRAGRPRPEGRPVRRRDRPRRDPPAQGRSRWCSPPTRASAPRPRIESLGCAAPGVRQGRQHHRRQRLADLRRRRRGGRDVEGEGRASSASRPLGEILGNGQVAGPDAVAAAPSRHGPSSRPSSRAGLSVGDVDLFELNEAFAAVGVASMKRPRHHRRHRQRQRRRHRPRPPHRHVGHPRRPHVAPRAGPPRWRRRRRRPVRRRRPGRRPDRQDAL